MLKGHVATAYKAFPSIGVRAILLGAYHQTHQGNQACLQALDVGEIFYVDAFRDRPKALACVQARTNLTRITEPSSS